MGSHRSDENISVPIKTQYPHSDTVGDENHDMGKEVGIRLRHARKLRGMTQQELAKKAKVPQSAISEVETGESKAPSGTNLVSLAQTLQVSSEWLAQGKGPMDPVDTPLPSEAVKFAREWMKLSPEVRESVAQMVRQMVKTSAADKEAVPDQQVEQAYGRPGRAKKRTPQ